jgi:hypothetical protein
MTMHKIQVPVMVLTLARKRLFLRWALKGFTRSHLDMEKRPAQTRIRTP